MHSAKGPPDQPAADSSTASWVNQIRLQRFFLLLQDPRELASWVNQIESKDFAPNKFPLPRNFPARDSLSPHRSRTAVSGVEGRGEGGLVLTAVRHSLPPVRWPTRVSIPPSPCPLPPELERECEAIHGANTKRSGGEG